MVTAGVGDPGPMSPDGEATPPPWGWPEFSARLLFSLMKYPLGTSAHGSRKGWRSGSAARMPGLLWVQPGFCLMCLVFLSTELG